MSQSQFIVKLYNQIATVLEVDEENKLRLKLKENLVETELPNDTSLVLVLKKLYETKKIGPCDFRLIIKASDSLGNSNLSKWLRDEEISNLASCLIKSEPNDDNNNIVDKSDQNRNHDTDRTNSTIVEINGVKLKLNFQPYKFQVSLAKLGCDGLNNIVCVRTGSGKTLVAALVCKYWIAKLGKNNFHAVFIVPTRHLAAQQMEAFVMAGFNLDDLEEIKETIKEPRTATYIRERQVVFLTAMKFYNALAQGQIRISDLSMLIFDECHHTTEKHPYNDIMRFYIQENQQQMAKMPIILGLTASLGVGRVKHAEKHLMKLCSNLRCTRISSLTRDEDIQDLKKNIPSVLDDEIIQVDIGPNGLIEFINSIIEYSENIQNVIGYSSGYLLGTPDYERTLHQLKKTYEEKNKRKELIGVRCLIDLNLIYLRAHDLPLDSCVEYAQECYDKMTNAAVSEHDDRNVKLMTSFCLKSLESLIESGKRFSDNPTYENTKLKKLVEIILKCHKGNSRGLILMRTRHGVTVMEKYLNKHPDLVNRQIQSVKLLGQNNTDDGISMNESEQKKAIEKFRKGECNILVATDIAQEGLDVPECNYVIRYEFVSNEIGTVQSRGRARANAGQLYLITQRDGLNYRRELENHERERDMQKAIVEFNKLDQNFITKEIESLYKEPPNLSQSASVQSFAGDSLFHMSPSIDSLSSFTFSAPSRAPTRTGKDSNPSHFHVHCRECGVGLFPATDLRFREPSYYSINIEFIRRAIRVEDTDLSSKVFHCARASCGNELGREVAMRRGQPLYMIDIKGVKFANKNKPGNFIVHAKWSKIEFNVKPL